MCKIDSGKNYLLRHSEPTYLAVNLAIDLICQRKTLARDGELFTHLEVSISDAERRQKTINLINFKLSRLK